MPIRVIVVDDSVLFRAKLQVSLSNNEIEVIAVSPDAIDAMKKISELKPDVVTLDVEMPKMSGIDFLKQLMSTNPTPVVVVSSLPLNALDALDAGAVDFVKKPGANPGALDAFIAELKEKIKIASRAKARRLPPQPAAPSLMSKLSNTATIKAKKDTIIAIGASTGGTEAIIEVVKGLPATAPGVVIVQHMPAGFTNLYAQRLDKICQMRVKEAQDMDRVAPGQIIIAAGENHLTLKKDAQGYYVRSRPGERVSGHCPSVDVLFDSVVETAGRNAIGVILTGMGADGAKGITKMKQAGSYTIGQDKGSCVVYGMPMEAFKLGGISRQLPLDQITAELIYQVNRMGSEA